MGLTYSSHQRTYETIVDWLERELTGPKVAAVDTPDLTLVAVAKPGVYAEVRFHEASPELLIVEVVAPITYGSRIDGDLMSTLLRLNQSVKYGWYAIDNEGTVLFRYLAASTALSTTYLLAIVDEVLSEAEFITPKILADHGGNATHHVLGHMALDLPLGQAMAVPPPLPAVCWQCRESIDLVDRCPHCGAAPPATGWERR